MKLAAISILAWATCGALALAVTMHQLRKYKATFTELIEYLCQKHHNQPAGPGVRWAVCGVLIALGPLSLIPIVADSIKRARI